MIINPQDDPMVQAVLDYQQGRPLKKLRVLSSMFDEDEMPIPYLFRTYDQMPPVEQKALDLCQGRILDIGACAGCHAIYLQDKGFDITAVDISALAVETMRLRGIKNAQTADMFQDTPGTDFNTILLLMNGTTIAGTLQRLPLFLNRLKSMLHPTGQILIDSTDLRYIYEDDNGVFSYEGDTYYGQVDYRMQYGHIKGQRFDCLYADPDTMQRYAVQAGLRPDIMARNDAYAYLMRLTPVP